MKFIDENGYWFYDPDFGFSPDFDEALEISLDDSETLETTDL